MIIFSIIVALVFAMNMGGSGISPSFAAPYGAGIISRKKAAIFFGLFVLLGAYTSGGNVIKTLSGGIIPQNFINPKVTLIILTSATLSLFLGSLLKVPLSTSSVTVSALVGTGLYFNKVYWSKIMYLVVFWISLPFISYVFTYILGKFVLHLEEHHWIKTKQRILKKLVIISGCYVAFSVGSNNVANAVSPLVASGILEKGIGVFIIAPFFGLGALAFGKGILNTIGKEITGIGVLGAVLNGLVIGSLLLICSFLGIPEPLVQLDAASIMALGSVNSGHKYLFEHDVIRKIASLWIISPLVSGTLVYILLFIFRC